MGGDDLVPPGTERLRLRRLTTADVDAIVELDSDPEVMRFLTGGVATPRATVRDEQVPRLLAQYERRPGLGRWAALDPAGGDFLGWFALDPSEDGSEAELGYRLRRSTWGRGLATEGSRALVRYAFDTVGVRRVWAETMAVNERSRRVLEKAGLRHVRTFHLQFDDPIPGTEHGEVEYELRADEWAAAQDRPAALRAR
ncbi:GNAT family N-acetyltransferase [Micromonospora lupini]|uniref:GCN5-related N-acetyltransferase n=1 Tax=Micromonospora lupini str. Lupac 08 TaxID=1150864 RepID=I0LD56_9ACTN|nr:GNAT family N-acetyltransferase [Micromonospora lupini]CCH21753.1 GCN5-related N-acetyltransferase [Micromonospora lupini str. Lupac 08]